MRQIEFRFYDDRTNEMIFSENCRDLFDFFEEYQMVALGIPELQQYTGLKDEKGQKIFEGDIVENLILKGVITYGRWLDSRSIAHVGFAIYVNKHKYCSLDGVTKILGNIYQNKELLNEVKK